jgi:TRAP-type C4-dicarboxylate transport system permease small subunit
LNDGPKSSWLHRISRASRALETFLIVVLLGGLVLFASAQIVLRNVFSIGVTWGDGLTRLAVLGLALLGALGASSEANHLAMGRVTQWLPGRYKPIVGAAADAIAAVVCGAFAYFSVEFVALSREYGDLLLTAVPAWWLQSLMPVAFALMALRFTAHAWARLRGG